MKILTFSNCPLVESQGSGYVILNYARGLAARGHAVDLRGPECFEPLRGIGLAKQHRQAVGLAFLAPLAAAFGDYDVVEFYGAESCLAASLLVRWPRRKFLLVSHSNGLETHADEETKNHFGHTTLDGLPPRLHQRFARLPFACAFRDVDALVTVSEFDAAYARKAGYQDASHTLALENPLAENYLGREAGTGRPQRIGYCGSWLAIKGTRLMEAAIPPVLEEFPRATFTLIGMDSGFRKESHFPASICERIEVIPFLTDKDELRRVYETLSIVLQPSIYESFGVVAAEAMASGCALVATNTGFAASLRHLDEAFILKESRVPMLHDALRILLANDELRMRLARNGRRRVQQLRWDGAVARLESAYHRWLDELRGRLKSQQEGSFSHR